MKTVLKVVSIAIGIWLFIFIGPVDHFGIMDTPFKWAVIYIGIGLMFAMGSLTLTVNSRSNHLNTWKITVAWLPALFISKVKQWVNDRKVGEKIKVSEPLDLKHKLENNIANLINGFERKAGLACKEITFLGGKRNKVVYIEIGDE